MFSRHRTRSRRLRTRGGVAVVAGLPLILLTAAPASLGSPTDAAATVSAARSLAGLAPVTHDLSLDPDVQLHANYLAAIGDLDHSEDPAHPLYTDAGNAAGNHSVLDALYGAPPASDHVDRWMQAPFHALELLDPQLATIGFATAHSDTPYFDQVAVMDTRSGRLNPKATTPVAWPGNGSVSSRTTFTSGEWPNPLTSCPGYSLPTGHPIYLRLPSDQIATHTALTLAGEPVEHCTITADTYVNPTASEQSLVRGLLDYAHAVVLIPRDPLELGSYDTTVTTTAATTRWVFSVGTDDSPGPNPTPTTTTTTTPNAYRHAADTAVAISQSLLADDDADGALVCRPDSYADCLAASVAADADTPLFFTNAPTDTTAPTAFSATTLTELSRILPAGGTVHLLGGTAAIPATAEAELHALGLNAHRIAGTDRYETAARIAATFAPTATNYLLARGHDWADAVAGGGLAATTGTPILLTGRDELPTATRAMLKPGDTATLLGGTAALADTVATATQQITGTATQRLAGPDRAATAVAIADAWPAPSDSNRLLGQLWETDGWQAALAATPLVDALDAPLLATTTTGVPAPTQQHLDTLDGPTLIDLGGTVSSLTSLLGDLLRGVLG